VNVQVLLWGVAVLALVGLVAVWQAGRSAAARARVTMGRSVTRVTDTLVHAAWLGAVIAGVQWLVLHRATDPTLQVAVLAVPAVLAGVTVARATAVTTIVHGNARHSSRGGRR